MSRGSVRLSAIGKRFGAVDVINGVDLAIAPGEFVVFVGPSGCGKSTLLRLIAGLETPTTGTIEISGRDVTRAHAAERGIAMVFQSYALYPHMSVAQNMGFGLRVRGMDKAEAERRVRETATRLQLDHLLERKPRELSGGQRQRVAIGRAIVREPEVFLFDEPLSNLDAALRGQMRVELSRLHDALGATMIHVTHDQVEAMTLADRIVVLNRGRIEQAGRPMDLYQRPANHFVAGFLGSPRMNFLPARLVAGDAGAWRVAVPSGELRLADRAMAIEAQAVTLGVRPEDLTPVDEHDARVLCAGEIALLECLGSESIAHVKCAGFDEPIVVKLAGDCRARAGETLRLGVDATRCHVFDAQGQALGRSA